jgi:predicted ATPase/class 3 adenylate cyclase
MDCPNCATQNPDGARFCFNCGKPLALVCGNCGTELPAGARFCFNCGAPTSSGAPTASTATSAPAAPAGQPTPEPGLPQTPPAGPSSDVLQRYIPRGLMAKLEAARDSGLMEGERKIVTILFCDVKGSTSAASTLDPEEWSEIINGAFQHMIEPIYRYEGTVARLMGDGLLAFFGAPIAHEDDPQRAILAGLDILAAIGRYRQEIARRWGLQFDVRVGINTGLVVIGAVGSDLRMEYTALGNAINMAARMEQTAEPGTVQVAEETHKLTAPLFDFEVVEGLQVKGKTEPVRAYRVLGVRAEPGRLRGIKNLEAPLIGRQEQLETLRLAVGELCQGVGQIVSVMGEAGLGKSRLIAEQRQILEADPILDAYWAQGHSYSYETNTPYAPFVDLFEAYFELKPDMDDPAQVSQIRERVEALLPGQGEALAPFLATMLGLQLENSDVERVEYQEPPQLRSMIFNSVRAVIESHVANRPLVLFLDDLHWADPTSLELLQSLLPLVNSSPLMIITAFRPRRNEPSWAYHEMVSRDYHYRYKVLSLSPLDQDQSRELVGKLLEVEDLPEQVRQMILDKSEGNPFFVEEVIRSLLDAELIVRQDNHWRATQEIRDVAIPDTLVGVINARLDRLDEDCRQITQAAAVLGRDFAFEALADVAERSADLLEPAMVDLQRREIIREKSYFPQRTYTFRHALTHQAAYDAILLSNRRELHRRAAESLTRQNPEQAGEIGRHWLGARQPGKAMPYLVKAGDQAARAYASAEAIDIYNRALELEATVDDFAPIRGAYEGLGNVLAFANRLPEAMEAYQTLLALAEDEGDVPAQISALNKLAATAALRLGQFQEGDQYLSRAAKLANQYDEQSGAAEMNLIHCQMCTAQADFEAVVEQMGELTEIGERLGSKKYMAMGLEHVATSLLYLTRFEEAQEAADKGLKLAREIGDREHEADLLSLTLPFLAIRNGDFASAKECLDEGIRIGVKIGALWPQVFGNWIRGELASLQGEYEYSLACNQQALDTALPFEQFMPFIVVPPLGSLGIVYLHLSDQFRDEVSKFHHHALRLLESPEATMTGGAAWADLGFCALTLGDLELAGEVFQKGLNHPSLFILLERARLLAGLAALALARGDTGEAAQLAAEAQAFAEEKAMRHVLPLTQLTQGRVLVAQGNWEAALAAFDQAEAEAQALKMRPYVWQARLAAAEVLETVGRAEEAEARREAARGMIQEIGDLITDQTLRRAYLDSALAKVAAKAT